MSIKIADITNLRVEGHSEHRATIAFETGDRRFHIWITYRDERGWEMDNIVHSNPIGGGGHTGHRELDLNAATHQKLRTFLGEHVGDTGAAANQAVRLMHTAREDADRDQRTQLATNIRESLDRMKADLPTPLYETLVDQDDDALINLRGAMYSAKYPENTYPIGILGIATTKAAA